MSSVGDEDGEASMRHDALPLISICTDGPWWRGGVGGGAVWLDAVAKKGSMSVFAVTRSDELKATRILGSRTESCSPHSLHERLRVKLWLQVHRVTHLARADISFGSKDGSLEQLEQVSSPHASVSSASAAISECLSRRDTAIP